MDKNEYVQILIFRRLKHSGEYKKKLFLGNAVAERETQEIMGQRGAFCVLAMSCATITRLCFCLALTPWIFAMVAQKTDEDKKTRTSNWLEKKKGVLFAYERTPGRGGEHWSGLEMSCGYLSPWSHTAL